MDNPIVKSHKGPVYQISGSKYNPALDIVSISRLLRKDLALAFPSAKFHVTSSRIYGPHIGVQIVDSGDIPLIEDGGSIEKFKNLMYIIRRLVDDYNVIQVYQYNLDNGIEEKVHLFTSSIGIHQDLINKAAKRNTIRKIRKRC